MMTPERWRAVDAVLQGALACEPGRRDAFVAEACGDDAELRQEVVSLLAAHDGAEGDDFLERPAAEALGIAPPPLGERLAAALAGRYTIEREIARGGMATIYLARDVRHDRAVAIKVLREDVAAAVGAERFLSEIRVTASLQHPHILPLFDSGSADGLLWYVMPYADGETLRTRLARERRLPVDEAVRLAREIADALDHAHARGVVHRDVKPENVLLQNGRAVVADFGIALALEQAGGERLTRTGLTVGTPEYMAPEQAAGDRALDARVDVYALGVVLHEMLAGESPFAGASRQAVVQRMLHEPPTALAARRPDVPAALDGAVRRALEKRPEARFPSAAAFAAALRAPALGAPALGAPALTPPAAEVPNAPRVAATGRVVSARTLLYALALALGAGLVGGLVVGRASLGVTSSSGRSFVDRWTGRARSLLPTDAAGAAGAPLVVLDRAGEPVREIAANRPWTPRFSPDGRQVAYGAFGPGRQTSDLWVTELATGTTRRLTDDDGDSNDPQWRADGAAVAYSVSARNGKDLALRPLAGDVDAARALASRDGTQFPSDWLRDGSALLVTEDAGENRRDILVQPADGSPARPYMATRADELAARVSPDGRWVAYTSDASGRAEVYLDAYPRPGHPVQVSPSGGIHPVWRGDGRELYYWRDGALVAVPIGGGRGGAALPVLGAEQPLFRSAYAGGLNTMYDVSPDGTRFVIVRR